MSTSGVFGTARWLESSDLQRNGFRRGIGPILGDVEWRRHEQKDGFDYFAHDWVRFPSEGHLCTVAKTGAGKFRSVIKPNLLTLPNSTIVIDNKGEAAEQTLRHRVEVLGHKVFLFDPYHVVSDDALPEGFKRSSFNPIEFIRNSDLSPFEAAMTIAQSFIKPGAKDPRWQIAAQLWLAANLIHVAFDPSFDQDPDLRTFETAWSFATRPDLKDSALAQMETSSDSFVAAQARSMREGKNKQGSETDSIEREFFIQCARIASSPEIQAAMRTSDLDFGQLRDEPITVYVVLPFRVAESQSGFFSMFLCCALDQIMARGPEKHRADGSKRPPVYFIMDEFLTQGRMDRMLRAFREIRGYNVALHAFVQDLGALKAVYGEEWGTILGNCGLIQYFGGTADLFTQDYFSKLTGQATLENLSYSASRTDGSSAGTSNTWGSSRGSNSGSSFSVSSSSSGSGSSVGYSSGSNEGTSVSTSTNEGTSVSHTTGVNRAVVAGTLMTPEQIGNLKLPNQILIIPGLGATDAVLLPDALKDFDDCSSPEALARLQEKTVRFRPCRTKACLGKVPLSAALVGFANMRQLRRELVPCPVCKGGSDSLCETVLMMLERGQREGWGVGPDKKGFQLEAIVGGGAKGLNSLPIDPAQYEWLRGKSTSQDRSDPAWRTLLDPLGLSGRYPEIYGQIFVDPIYQNVSWTLYDEQHPNRPRNENPYVLPSTRETWERAYEKRFFRQREALPAELKQIEARVVQEPVTIYGEQPNKPLPVHPYPDIFPPPAGTLPQPTAAHQARQIPCASPAKLQSGNTASPTNSVYRVGAYALIAVALYLLFLFFSERYRPMPFRLVVAAALLAGARFLWTRSSQKSSGT